MAQTFYPITPTEITASGAGSWVDMDASGSAPSGSTGVVLHIVNNSSNTRDVGIRKNGSTDDRHDSLYKGCHCWAAIGVDANRVFEAYVGNVSDIDVYVVAYTKSGVTFLTNGVNKCPAVTGSWQDADCSSEAPSAIGLIFNVTASGAREIGFRKNGSTDNRHDDFYNHCGMGTIIGCDASQICEIWAETDYEYIDLVGYVTDGCTFNTNATDVSLGSTGSWIDLSALPSGANMGFIEVITTGVQMYGLRKNGSSEELYYDQFKHCWGMPECDASQLIEGKIENTGVDFFVVGYSEAEEGPTEKTGSDTGTGTDAKASNNPVATLTKSETGSGIEGTSTQTASLARSETGTGSDVLSEALAILERAESGSGVETLLGRAIVLPEIGSGVDALSSLLGALSKSDSGSGVDSLASIIASLVRSETGSGIDSLVSLLSALIRSDTGSGVDNLLNRLIALAESGSGSELASLLYAITKSDTGTGVDALVELYKGIIEKFGTDTGSGSELASLLYAITKAETGSGVDALTSLLATITKSDSGSGADALVSLLATLTKSETGTGVDNLISLLATLAKSDSGVGTDSLLNRLITLADSGSGLEALLNRAIVLTESGIGAGTSLLLATLLSTETGTGLDALVAVIYALTSSDSGVGLEALANLLALITTSEVGSGSEQLRAKIMTSAGVSDMKLPTKMGKTEIPSKGVNL